MKTGLPQTSPGQCPCFRASRQFPGSFCLCPSELWEQEGGPSPSVLKRNKTNRGLESDLEQRSGEGSGSSRLMRIPAGSAGRE